MERLSRPSDGRGEVIKALGAGGHAGPRFAPLKGGPCGAATPDGNTDQANPHNTLVHWNEPGENNVERRPVLRDQEFPILHPAGPASSTEASSVANILFVGTHGADGPARATFPFVEAKSAIEAGHEAGIILLMEAAPLIKDSISAQVQGFAVTRLKESMDFLHARRSGFPSASPVARLSASREDKNSGFGTSLDAANACPDYDKVVTF